MPTIDEEILRLRTTYRRDNNLDLQRATIGDAQGNVPADIPGWVWVRVQSSNGLFDKRRVLPPAGKAMSLKAGTAVTLEYDKMGNLRIAEPDTQAQLSGGVNVVANVVQPDATPRLTQGSIETLRAIPTNPASLIVGVKAWAPIIGGTQYFFAGAAVDLTSFVPAAGNMRYAVIFVKSDYASTEVFASTARSTADVPLDSADIQECITAASAGSTPVWAIKLVGGQTTITQDNIEVDGVDLRQMVNTSQGSGTVSGPASSTDRAIATWNGTGGTALRDNPTATINAGGDITVNSLSTWPSWTTTISAGAIAVSGGLIVVSASSGVTDNLATVSSIPNGKYIVLQAATGHTITVKHGTGNIFLNGGADFALSGDKSLLLFCDGTNWADVGAGGGGSGAPTTATYITQTPDATLSAEQALSALATGYMKVTTGTGVVSSQATPIPEADGGTGRTTGAATKALDNLASTAVNADILPATDNSKSLGSAALRYSNIWAVNTLNDVNAIPVKNVSGSTANANDVGILQYDATNGYSYTTTTTANLFAEWCVVIVGAANNSTIYVATQGKVTVKLNANCAIKDFLLTSTTAGQASVSTTMRPEIFAIALTANAGGAGGTCTAQLLCKTKFIPQVSSNLLWGCYNHSASDFVSVINGAPTATSVTYGNISAGAANAIVPANAGDLGKMILWNTTRGTGRLITAVNTGTKVITTVSTTDSWASTDAITIESQTVVNAAAARFVDVDLSQQTTIPTMARNIWIMMQKFDSGGTNITQIAHPWETIASSKNKTLWLQVANFWIDTLFPLPLINGRFAVAYGASGAGTALDEMYLQGYNIAAP